ncbi:DUF2157 domain-containing protein [Seonamhaeicola marinus]|uniref:DUF2157 domain-containing protein n=1 Tax=Seonamhaeicola marinus TaxID=1912246 RepID=A0A5D0HUC6_9FLAO|nr:DUF2157 domain-containing protein [Seonamhaeicola marinus]
MLGSVLVGLGIILILAHNWDDFSKTTKTILAFLPLVIGQIISGYSILKNKSKTWKEASGTFLFFAVGSSISLVSQIYNIPGNLSSFLLTWTLLCAPLMYLLRSNMLAILHIVFMTYYAVEYGYNFISRADTPWFYVLLLVLVLPYYIKLIKSESNSNIASIFNWLLPLSLIIVLGAFVQGVGTLGVLMYVLLFGVLYNIGKLGVFSNQKLRRNGFLVLASLGTVYMLMLTSFEWMWDELLRDKLVYNTQEFYISLMLFLVASALFGYLVIKRTVLKFNIIHYVFAIFSAVFFIGLSSEVIPSVLINLLVLCIAIVNIKIGADKFHFGILNYGLLIIALLITCRFFDTNMSFVVRGILFVCIGLGFFLTNYVILKKQKKNKIELKK